MKKLLKNMSIYGLGGVASRAIQFLLLPVYTRVLTTSEYGSLELIYITFTVLGMLYGFMISSGLIRYYFDKSDTVYRDQVLGSAFWFTFVNSIIFAAVSFLLADRVADMLFKFENGGFYIRLITVSAALKAHSTIFYSLLIARERAKRYVSINIIILLLLMIITIYLVVFKKMGISGILIAQIISFTVEFVILSMLLFRKTIFSFSLAVTREMLKYSIPFIPLQMASFVLSMSDRFFLQEFRTLDEVGLYSLGYKFATVLLLLTMEPFKGFPPYIFNLAKQPEKCKQALADFGRYNLAAGLFLALVMGMFSREIIMVMSDISFHDASKVVFWLCISYVFYGLYFFSSYAIKIVKKNWLISISWVITVTVCLTLNFSLVPEYGINGAITASMISCFMLMVSNLIIGAKIYRVQYKYFSFVSALIFTGLIYYISTFIEMNITFSILLKLMLLAVFTIGILSGGYFTKDERSRAAKVLKTDLFERIFTSTKAR